MGQCSLLSGFRNNNPQPIADVLSHDVTSFWLNALPDEYDTTRDIGDSLARLRGLLSIQDPGYGLERVLYESNPAWLVKVPFVIKEGVVLIEQLLHALDHAANDTDTSSQPIDRHIAGFIAARFNEDIHPHLKAMASQKPDTSVIGTLSLLAFLNGSLEFPLFWHCQAGSAAFLALRLMPTEIGILAWS